MKPQISSGHSTSTYDDTSHDVTGVYTGTYGNTGTSTATDSSTSTMIDGSSTSAVVSNDGTTSGYTYSGNSFAGTYTNIDTDSGTTTSSDIESNTGLSVSSHMTDTYGDGSTETGDQFSGDYTVTGTGSETSTNASSGSLSDHTYSATGSATSSYTHSDGGNSFDGTDEATDTSSSNSTQVTNATYSDGSDTQTASSSGSTTMDSFSDDFEGTYDQTGSSTSDATMHEVGNRGSAYSLYSTYSSSGTTTEDGNSFSGDYVLSSTSGDATDTLRTGTDGSGNSFDISQALTAGGGASTTGNHIDGSYSTHSAGSQTLVTTEDNSGSSASISLTETVINGSDITQTGNDFTGDFSAVGLQTDSSSLTESGYNSHGTFTLAESSSDSPTVTTTGNTVANDATISTDGDQSYSINEYNSSGSAHYTMTESGDKSYSKSETLDGTSGADDSVETGTDTFSILELDSASNTQVETGTDTYTLTDDDNINNGNFDHVLSRTGHYTLTFNGSYEILIPTIALAQETSGDGADAQITDTQGASFMRYDLLGLLGVMPINEASDSISGLSGVTGFSEVGPMVQGVGFFPPATGEVTQVGDAAFKYCFAKGTLVLLADGTSKAIETLENGQEVLAIAENDPSAQPRACKVLQVFHNDLARIFEVRVADEIIRTTAGHPFFVNGKGWVKVRDLIKGDELRTPGGKFLKVQSVVDSGKTEPVFNLEVAEDHTYFVVLPVSRHGVWVHNLSPEQKREYYEYSWRGDPFLSFDVKKLSESELDTLEDIRRQALNDRSECKFNAPDVPYVPPPMPPLWTPPLWTPPATSIPPATSSEPPCPFGGGVAHTLLGAVIPIDQAAHVVVEAQAGHTGDAASYAADGVFTLGLNFFGGEGAEAKVVSTLAKDGTKVVTEDAAKIATTAAENAALGNANFAQKTFGQAFSSEGAFAGRSVEDVAAALRSGGMKAGDVPVQYIVRDGQTLILNTRSAQALEQAGIPRAQWNAVNMTGDAASEARLTGQLQRNGLTSQGTPTVRPSGR